MQRNLILVALKQIKELMRNEYRRDVEFRVILLLSQIGDIAKYVTHDKNLNPKARPHGTSEDEVLAYGQVFVQLLACAQLRGIDIKYALDLALRNWRDYDWMGSEGKRQGQSIRGTTAYRGVIQGIAFLDLNCKKVARLKSRHVLITQVLRAEIFSYIKNIKGIVTDHGGMTSHAAIVAREYKIPCIVGTGNATKKIAHGQKVFVNADPSEGVIYLR